MKTQTICGMTFDVIEDGDILHAGIKNQRNDAARFVYSKYLEVWETIKKFLEPILDNLQVSGFIREYNMYKEVLKKIADAISKVGLHLTEVKEGDDVRPEHVNELYEPFPKLSTPIVFAVQLVQGMTFMKYKKYIEGLDRALQCVSTYEEVYVRHLDLIQAGEWNAILDMVANCCFSLKIVREDADAVRELTQMAIDFANLVMSVPKELAEEIARCIETGEGCEKAMRDLEHWAMLHLIDFAIRLLKYAEGMTLMEFITQILPKVLVIAGIVAGILMAKSIGSGASRTLSEKAIENIVRQIQQNIVNSLVQAAEAAQQIENSILRRGEYKGNNMIAISSVYCLGVVYLGPTLGTNDKYTYMKVGCLEAYEIIQSSLPSYVQPNLKQYLRDICVSNNVYLIYSTVTESAPNVRVPIAIVSVKWIAIGTYAAVYIKIYTWYTTGTSKFDVCVKLRTGYSGCLVSPGTAGRVAISFLYLDIYGNAVAGGFNSEQVVYRF